MVTREHNKDKSYLEWDWWPNEGQNKFPTQAHHIVCNVLSQMSLLSAYPLVWSIYVLNINAHCVACFHYILRFNAQSLILNASSFV